MNKNLIKLKFFYKCNLINPYLKKNAPTGIRTRVEAMATLHSATKLLVHYILIFIIVK